MYAPDTEPDTCPRSMAEMLDSLQHGADARRVDDGWRHSLPGGLGFRHDYDAEVARGGWEFYQLGRGLCVASVDMMATRTIPRRHYLDDYLVLSAVLEGTVPIHDPSGSDGQLANGYCTVYGLAAGTDLQTIYEPGRVLKWVSVFIERHALLELTGLQLHELPASVGGFVVNGTALPHRNVPLSRQSLLAATQLSQCPYQGGFRHAFLTAKALELACHILFVLARRMEDDLVDACLSQRDYDRLRLAMDLIQRSIEQPLNIGELAVATGMNRQRLQLGFRAVYGGTVAKVRDQFRMELALDLVRETSQSMLQIALETGYEHAASFTRAFKSAYGVSPAQMRRLANEKHLIARLPSGPGQGAAVAGGPSASRASSLRFRGRPQR
ncbi:MAG: AraC family transcriptional regulator [Pseudoxanthomonas sp.]